MTKLSKQFERKYCLAQVMAYSDAVFKLSEWSGHNFKSGFLTVHDKNQPLLGLYNNNAEVAEFYKKMYFACSNTKKVETISKKLLKSVKKIEPFLSRKRTVKNLSQFKKFYKEFVDFYFYESVVWVVPQIEKLPAKTRSDAMALRKTTEKLSSLRDKVLEWQLNALLPNIDKNLISFVDAKLVFSGSSEAKIKKEAQVASMGYIYFRGKLYIGKRYDEFFKKRNISLDNYLPNDNIETFNGEIASRGKVVGKAKIILTSDELGKIENGDILVSPMTRPDFLPAMNRAAAFVTDEGGITCHAAIVARELKKPCIIGTKIATQVLKDGDLLEVDAERGIVTIIKKADDK